MIDLQRRKNVLQRGRPQLPWSGEPSLGSVYGEEEIEAVVEAIRSSMNPTAGFTSSSEPIVQFEREFADYVGTNHAITINSAGPGLDMAMHYLDLQPGDEVIVPAINFVASPMAVMGAGGQVIWGEVDEKTLQLDPNDVERRISPRTRAIFPVHFNGLSSPMDDLIELGQRHPHEKHGPIPVIGDGARACGGGYRDTKIGKKGLLNVFSFHTMKNMVTLGEGGMITTDDDRVNAYCRGVRFYGLTEEVWGTSNTMTKVQAAAGRVQLGRLDGMIDARRRLAHQRNAFLDGVAELTLPHEPDDCRHSFYLHTCLVPRDWAGRKRDALMTMMKDEFGVGCVVANPPVYEMRKVMREHTAGQSMPLTEQLGKRIFCVPIHPAMSDDDNEYLSAAVIECVERLR